MDYYFKVLRRYFDYSGRARRAEFWVFWSFDLFFAFCCIALDNWLNLTFGRGPYGMLLLLYLLATLSPRIGVRVRRLHDLGLSGWFLLLGFIPVLGATTLLVLYLLEGTAGNNRHGPNPKEIQLST